MPRYVDHSTEGAPPGGVFLHTEDGQPHLYPAADPSVALERARIDQDKAKLETDEAKEQELASNDDAGRIGGALFGDPSQRQAPVPSVSDVAPLLAGPAGPADPRAQMARAAATQARVNGGPPPPQGQAPPQGAGAFGGVATAQGAAPGGGPSTGGVTDARRELEDLDRRRIDQALHGGGPAHLMRGGTFETGSSVTTGGKVPQTELDALGNEMGRSADNRVATEQAKADLDYKIGQRQRSYQAVTEADDEVARDERRARMSALHDEQTALAREIGNTRIDSDHYWDSKSTGNKILTGIALALGAMGAARTGGPNVALEHFHASIKQDIDLQKEKLARKEKSLSALGQAYQRFREEGLDEEQATRATRAVGMQRIASQATQLANSTGNPLAVERAGLIRQEADEQVARTRYDAAAAAAARSQTTRHFTTTQDRMVGGGGPNLDKAARIAGERVNREQGDQKLAAEMSKGGSGGEVVAPDGTVFSVGHLPPEQQGKTREHAAQTGQLVRSIDALADFYKKHGTHPVTPAARAARDALVNTILAQDSQANGQGAMTDSEATRKGATITGFGGEEGLAAMRANVVAGAGSRLSAYGAKPVR